MKVTHTATMPDLDGNWPKHATQADKDLWKKLSDGLIEYENNCIKIMHMESDYFRDVEKDITMSNALRSLANYKNGHMLISMGAMFSNCLNPAMPMEDYCNACKEILLMMIESSLHQKPDRNLKQALKVIATYNQQRLFVNMAALFGMLYQKMNS